LKPEIEKFKKDIVSGEEKLANSAAIELGEIGGDDIVEFLITLLDLNDPAIRNRAALALRDIKDNRALGPMLEAICKKENNNFNGTLVYALESLDCSKNLKDIFKILFYESYEAKISADKILSNQIFDFTKQDIIEIKQMWEDCIMHPEKCPGIDDEETKLFMQESVDGFKNYIDDNDPKSMK